MLIPSAASTCTYPEYVNEKPKSLAKNAPPNEYELIRFFRWSWEHYQAIQAVLPTSEARFITAYEDPKSVNQIAIQLRFAALRKYFAPSDELNLENKVIPALIRITESLELPQLDIRNYAEALERLADLINKKNRPTLAQTSFGFPETTQDQIDRVMYGGLLHGDYGKWEFIYGSHLNTVGHQNMLFSNLLTQELWVQNLYGYTQSIQENGLADWTKK